MSKVLMLSYLPIFPTNGGGRVRVRQLATHLSERHSVALVCPSAGDSQAGRTPFRVYEAGRGGAGQLLDLRAWRTIVEAAQRERPDCILVEYIWQGLGASLLGLMRRAPVVLDAFDVATVRFRRAGSPLWSWISLYERLVLRAASRVLAVSAVDRSQLVALGAREDRTAVVPNGVATTEFRPDVSAGRAVRSELGIADHERLLLFFGQLNYQPNSEAVRLLAREVLPRLGPEYRLAVAGPGLTPKLRAACAGERLAFLGAVDPLAAYVNAADTVVVPVLRGSGTRLKILESLACGTPTVATPLAAEGLDLDACGPALRIAGGWDSFASALETASKSERVPPTARFIETYEWRAIVERMPIP